MTYLEDETGQKL